MVDDKVEGDKMLVVVLVVVSLFHMLALFVALVVESLYKVDEDRVD